MVHGVRRVIYRCFLGHEYEMCWLVRARLSRVVRFSHMHDVINTSYDNKSVCLAQWVGHSASERVVVGSKLTTVFRIYSVLLYISLFIVIRLT